MPLPPPPKKRDRPSLDKNLTSPGNPPCPMGQNSTSNNRPAKKEKPAPVTMIYRGDPEDHRYARAHNRNNSIDLNPTALPSQAVPDLGLDPISRITPIAAIPPSTAAPSYSLSHATEASLMKKKLVRLRDLCRERDLLSPTKELTKREMVQALLHWRQINLSSPPSQGLSVEDSVMSSVSESETDDQDSLALTAETSFEDSIDPQLFSPELNPGIYNLRPRKGVAQQVDFQETIRTSQINTNRKGLPEQFSYSPQTQLANYFAATGLHHHHNDMQVMSQAGPNAHSSPRTSDEVMSHPPTIPLLDDPVRNSKRRSIRLVGTKIPSIGPISKLSMSNIVVGGNGPTVLGQPQHTVRVTTEPKTAKAGQGTLIMKSSHQPPSPPTSIETDQHQSTGSGADQARVGEPTGSGEDLDVLLDLEDLKLSDKEIPAEKLMREQKVGSGSFKDVYMGRYRNFRVAICDLRGRLTDMDIKELGLLRDLRHPNIVRFIGVSVGDTVPCTIVTELCRNGDLYDYIRKIPCPPFAQILAMMLDAARGVEYLHLRTPSIIHRDLKSPNVLITANGSAKITDFGLARVKRDVMSMCATTCGTLNWQAPELWVAHPAYNHSIDVYALGLVFWEVLCWPFKEKTYPFQGMNEHAIFAEVGRNRLRPSTSMVRRRWGRDIVELIEKMWSDDSNQRPPMPEVVRGLNAMLLQEREKAWAASCSDASG